MATIPSLTRLCTLGRGSTSTVSLASDPISGRLFAVKSAELSQSFPLRNEHRILSGLSSPHIISCHGSYTDASHFHLLLEFFPCGSLFDQISSSTNGRLEERDIRSYTRDILLGLSYLHSNLISHGDIKSQNILIGSDGHAKIADFGASSLKTGTHNGTSGFLSGTPAFMAPEVARGEECGPAAEIWALGCTIIQMATGKAPWHSAMKDQDVMAAIYRIGYCSDSMPDVPDWLSEEGKDFVMNCLKRKPGDRWSAEQLLNHPFVRLSEAGSGSGSAFSPQSALDYGSLFSEPETEDEDEVEDEATGSDLAARIRELAGSGLFGLDADDEGWIEVRSRNGEGNGGEVTGGDGVGLELVQFFFNEQDNSSIHVTVTCDVHICTVNSINENMNSGLEPNAISFLYFHTCKVSMIKLNGYRIQILSNQIHFIFLFGLISFLNKFSVRTGLSVIHLTVSHTPKDAERIRYSYLGGHGLLNL